MTAVPSVKADVLVIGGGATGAGVAWDAALRGFDVVLVERGDLAEGTSGRFHGLLHSGGRYVVKDPVAARECVDENAILRRVIPDCIEDTGGLFVTTPDDDPAYGDRFMEGCRATGLPAGEIPVGEALRREPRLNPGIRRAFTVPDASIDAWKTVGSLARGAAEHGARILPYHRVTDLHRDADAITGARVRNELTGEDLDVEAGFVLNASGAWAAQILHMAGIEDVGVIPGKGIMIAMNHRLVNTVINRCTMPADEDIVDAMCDQLGEERPCRTREERPPGNEDSSSYMIGSRLVRREETLLDEQLICECELIGRSRLEAAMRRRGTHNLDDIRRAMRLGMGPCQGGFCIYRATGILHALDRMDGEEAADSLVGLLEGRR